MDPVDYTILALTLWREGRGESQEGRRAILHVILNRVHDPRWPNTSYDVCLQPKQFSCHNANDPNATLWPTSKNTADWNAWKAIRELVDAPGEDPTRGANHYHVEGLKPAWAEARLITARIGHHVFYKR